MDRVAGFSLPGSLLGARRTSDEVVQWQCFGMNAVCTGPCGLFGTMTHQSMSQRMLRALVRPKINASQRRTLGSATPHLRRGCIRQETCILRGKAELWVFVQRLMMKCLGFMIQTRGGRHGSLTYLHRLQLVGPCWFATLSGRPLSGRQAFTRLPGDTAVPPWACRMGGQLGPHPQAGPTRQEGAGPEVQGSAPQSQLSRSRLIGTCLPYKYPGTPALLPACLVLFTYRTILYSVGSSCAPSRLQRPRYFPLDSRAGPGDWHRLAPQHSSLSSTYRFLVPPSSSYMASLQRDRMLPSHLVTGAEQ